MRIKCNWRGQRISNQELISEARQRLKEAGVVNHQHALFVHYLAQEVIGNACPRFAHLQPKVKARNLPAWSQAYKIVMRFIADNNLELTRETVVEECQDVKAKWQTYLDEDIDGGFVLPSIFSAGEEEQGVMKVEEDIIESLTSQEGQHSNAEEEIGLHVESDQSFNLSEEDIIESLTSQEEGQHSNAEEDIGLHVESDQSFNLSEEDIIESLTSQEGQNSNAEEESDLHIESDQDFHLSEEQEPEVEEDIDIEIDGEPEKDTAEEQLEEDAMIQPELEEEQEQELPAQDEAKNRPPLLTIIPPSRMLSDESTKSPVRVKHFGRELIIDVPDNAENSQVQAKQRSSIKLQPLQLKEDETTADRSSYPKPLSPRKTSSPNAHRNDLFD